MKKVFVNIDIAIVGIEVMPEDTYQVFMNKLRLAVGPSVSCSIIYFEDGKTLDSVSNIYDSLRQHELLRCRRYS
ncbi:MAG: hypothetical protein INQ03_08800 [Candidatus Heimdallarchaeota archaeon]|nr:hypothetical protein [Candidatus Heimdallarchaeota archaeon]